MARFTPSGTTAATVAQATAPAPQPKPATATLPAPSRPAATTAPAAPRAAAPKAASAEEAEKARRRAAFEAESKAVQEERLAYYKAQEGLRPYLEAVDRVAELRRVGQAGTVPASEETATVLRAAMVSPANVGAMRQPSVQTTMKEAMPRDPKGYGRALPPIVPSQLLEQPDLRFPALAAERAKAIDAEYQKARQEYAEEEARIRQLEGWKAVGMYKPQSGEDFPDLARAQQARLQRVVELAAARREYGLTD